jgi:hypothetical protein
MKQILSEEFKRIQKLAGVITENQLNGDKNVGLMSFIKANKKEIIKQLNQKEAKDKSAKTIDFQATYEENNKVYAERDYLPIGEKDEKRTGLDEISFSFTKGKYEITVNGKQLKYSIFNI